MKIALSCIIHMDIAERATCIKKKNAAQHQQNIQIVCTTRMINSMTENVIISKYMYLLK